jgi:two-component system, NtrC family, sensor kinase
MNLNDMTEQRSRILAIDDTPDNLRLLIGIFDPKEYIVFPARSGSLALSLLKSNLPDLILLDINMPDMDGFELCKILKGDPKTRDIPVIFISGRDDPDAVTQGFAVGGVDFILKPFRSSEVLARSNAHLMLKHYRELLKKQNVQLQETVQSLAETQRQLARAENLSSLNQLVSGVAHEINTPIGVCITASSYLSRISEDMGQTRLSGTASIKNYSDFLDETSEAAKMIENSLETAVKLINSLKMMTEIKQLEPMQIFSVCDALNETIANANKSLKPNQVITLDCCSKTLLSGSIEAFCQIFSSLIANSLFHGFENRQDGEIDIHVEEKNGHIEVLCSDNGVGIPEEYLDKIFNPFFTTKRAKGNTGLGLFAVYQLLTLYFDGKVICESTPGEGTRFTLTFPQTNPNTLK